MKLKSGWLSYHLKLFRSLLWSSSSQLASQALFHSSDFVLSENLSGLLNLGTKVKKVVKLARGFGSQMEKKLK